MGNILLLIPQMSGYEEFDPVDPGIKGGKLILGMLFWCLSRNPGYGIGYGSTWKMKVSRFHPFTVFHHRVPAFQTTARIHFTYNNFTLNPLVLKLTGGNGSEIKGYRNVIILIRAFVESYKVA